MMDDYDIKAIGDALRAENPAAESEASFAVLISVLVAIKQVDERWIRKEEAGQPSVTDYASHIIEVLRRRYGGPGVIL